MTSSTTMDDTATLPEEDWAMATGNMYRNFAEVWTCSFRDIHLDTYSQTDRQTDRKTDR